MSRPAARSGSPSPDECPPPGQPAGGTSTGLVTRESLESSPCRVDSPSQADRNFCTKLLLFECAAQQACFLVRHHAGLSVEAWGPVQGAGRCATGAVAEGQVVVAGQGDEPLTLWRITIQLDEPTAAGEREIHLLTNLPAEVSAARCAELYHARWSIKAAFGELTLSLRGEIDTLCYPKAALLAYAIALVTYNLLTS